MDPVFDDPNNHAPPVAPHDGWGDLDEVQVSPAPGLPHVRSDSGNLPGKRAMKPLVNRHAPKLKIREESSHAPLEPRIGVMEEDGESFDKPGNPPPEPEETAASGAASETESADDEGGKAERIVLPVPQGGNRHRVNEIDAQRAARMFSTSDAETEEKAIQTAARPRALFSREGQGEWGDESTPGSFRWMLYTGVGVIALVVVTVVLNRLSPGENVRERSIFSQMTPDETHTDVSGEDSGMMAMLTDGQQEAKRIFAKYATARTSADFIGSVHRAEEMAGLIKRSWEPLGAKPGWQPDEHAVWTVLEQESVLYGVLEGGFPDFSSYRAFFRQDEDGLKMDWKATFGYCSADFGTLQKGRGDGGEIRAWLSPVSFHTFSLPEREFRSFRLVSPDRQQSLWGYAEIGGELDGELNAQFIPSQITGEAKTEVEVILSLGRGPAESLPNQWMITKLIRLNWLDE